MSDYLKRIEELIAQYRLQPHPEGGFYGEHYRSEVLIPPENIRTLGTAIYFLLPAGTFSAFHQLDADEVWHFYEGGALNIYILGKNGWKTCVLDGKTLHSMVIPAHTWFASEPAAGATFSFCGCTVAPAFMFEHFIMGAGTELVAAYPEYEADIKRLCRL